MSAYIDECLETVGVDHNTWLGEECLCELLCSWYIEVFACKAKKHQRMCEYLRPLAAFSLSTDLMKNLVGQRE